MAPVPARPRRSRGVRKRYTEEPLVLEGEDEPPIVAVDQSEDEDFDAGAEAQQAKNDEDEEDGGEDDDEDALEVDPSDDDAVPAPTSGKSGTSAAKGKVGKAQPKRLRNTGTGMIQSRKGFHDIPQYPLETRIVTRVYAGPLRRYARYSALRDAMYGPEYQRIKIVWDLEGRWTDYPLLPPRSPPDHPQGIVPSPWLPAHFEREQERRARQWYEECRARCPDLQQSHPIDTDYRPLLPESQRGIVTLLGPWDQQREFTLAPGSTLPLTALDLPPEGTESEGDSQSGWIFDVGGIPLAMAWAPLSTRNVQVLAVAIIPFSDQEQIQKKPANPPEKSDNTDTIQLWEIPGDNFVNGLASPSKSQVPRLAETMLFDWGRPKRLQWCPVPLDESGICGLLAVLCGDGMVRVIEVKGADGASAYRCGVYHRLSVRHGGILTFSRADGLTPCDAGCFQ